MKIILSVTPEFFPSTFTWMSPTGLLYLGAVLEREGYNVKVVDPVLEKLAFDQFIDAIVNESPDVFSLTVYSDTYFKAVEVFREVKKRLPSVITIAGGPGPTLLGQGMLENCKGLDIIVYGEGEAILPEIIERIESKKPLEGIPNISYRNDDQIVNSLRKHLNQNLDDIPFPAYHLVDLSDYKVTFPFNDQGEIKAINIITSRGCPFNCIFCSNTNLNQLRVSYRSVENVIQEIKFLIKTYDIGFFFIQDDSFNLNKNRIVEFCNALEREKINIRWTCIMRADKADKDLLKRMKDVGFSGGCFAIETMNDHIREEVIGKKVTREQIVSTIDAFNELDLVCAINWIVSLPDQTLQDMYEDLKYIETMKFSNKNSYIALNILRIYPGTRLEIEAKKRGILKDNFTWFDMSKMIKNSPGTLPGIYGVVPIYREKLSITDIFEAVFRWKYSINYQEDPGKSSTLLTYLWLFIVNIKTPADVWNLCSIARAWVRVLLLKLKRKISRSAI